MNTMPGRQVTEDMYNRALQSFRQDPGNVLAAARAAGIARPTAKKLWQGPLSKNLGPWARPCCEVVAEEAHAQHQQKLAREAAERRTASEELERRARLEGEAARMEENALRIGRSNLLTGMGLLASMQSGLKAMAKRVNEQLERGTTTGPNGAVIPIDIDPEKALRLIAKHGSAMRDMTLVGKQLIELHRLQEGLPTAIVGVKADLTLDDAEDLMATANQALARARRQDHLAKAVEVEGPPAPLQLPAQGETGLLGDDEEVDEGDDLDDDATPLEADEDPPPEPVPALVDLFASERHPRP